MKIKYVIGDATSPQGKGDKIICHICNDIGAWGAGFVLAISAKWGYPEHHYRAKETYRLGDVDILSVDGDDDGNVLYVANMIGQHKVGMSKDGIAPIRYTAVADALEEVNEFAVKNNCTLHMPRIGCGLAGGEWKAIEAILEKIVTVDVTVYDLN